MSRANRPKVESVPSGSDIDDYRQSEDLRSVPVLWTLVVSRYSAGDHELQRNERATQANPFNLETITKERTIQPQIEDYRLSDESSQNVIEVITDVYDPLTPLVQPTGKRDKYGLRRRDTGGNTILRSRELSEDFRSCRFLGQSIVLHSSLIRKFLQSVTEYYPEHPPSSFNDVVIIEEPFAFLIHHFSRIEDHVDCDHPNEAAHSSVRSHLIILRDLLKPIYEGIQNSVEPAIRDNAISFDLIWYILQPGIDVYIVPDGEPHICVIESVWGQPKKPTKPFKEVKKWHINMVCLDTAKSLTMVQKRTCKYIRSFNGLREIISLPVCPVSVWDALDNGVRRAQVLRRNGMYLEGLQQNKNGHMYCVHSGVGIGDGGRYCGKVIIDHQNSPIAAVRSGFVSPDQHAVFAKYGDIYLRDEPPTSSKIGRNDQRHAAGARGFERWMSDVTTQRSRRNRQKERPIGPASSSSYSENLQPNLPDAQSGELFAKETLNLSEITDHERLLIWPQAPAFALSTKQWMTISLGNVERVEPSEDSIKNLQLDPAAVQIIKALSTQRDQSGYSWGADFIEGKGSGQIILLHGPPGVGKTYTVEGISEWLRRPLISLTVADIGTTETRVEQELMKWFDLAEAWNAVLLVDEADIFLEQRKNRDLSRNGLVSAFLRRMEYFRGLLFLTTNRVGQIDDAFMSRVHMAIGYERLSPDFRRNIWEGFFRKLERERAGKILVGPSARKFVLHSDEVRKIELNGREIRNALQTAITLAEFESLEGAGDPGESGATPSSSQIVIVEEDHFRRVLKMSEKFHDYVTAIRREDEVQRAKVRGDRDDYAKVGAVDGRSK